MDAERPSFVLPDLSEENFKPVPPQVRVHKKYQGSIKLPDYYPKYEVEFYDVVTSCAEYIDRIKCLVKRLKFHKHLSKIFVIRHKGSVMSLFRDLVNDASKN